MKASNIKNISLIALSAITLSGCAASNGVISEVKNNQDIIAPSVKYEMIGIPLLYQGFGSSVPITKDLSLTAAHVAKINWSHVVSYHPECDIAIIESDNSQVKNFPDLGLVYPNEKTYTYGNGWFASKLKGVGVYHVDLNFTNNSYFRKCNASITDAPIREGMSGGAVMNSQGDLVGIISSMASIKNTRLANGEKLPYKRLSLFVSLNFVKGWLNDTVNNYYHSDNVLNWNNEISSQLAKNN